MVQFSELKREDNTDLSEEDIKEAHDYIGAYLKKRLKASRMNKESMLIHLCSGETITCLLSDIDNITFK